MKKSMYSLILTDEVVRKIDEAAASQGTNRSNLVNQILAEYVSVVTPEKRIQGIFNAINEAFGNKHAFRLYSQPHELTMSIKSSLDYRYRPTIRYEVEMYRTPAAAIGSLSVVFRTQSPELLVRLTEFFKVWIRLESVYISHFYPEKNIKYTLEDGRLIRSFAIPQETEYDAESTGKAIGDYVQMFDDIMKQYLGYGFETYADLEKRYLNYLNSGMKII